MKIYQSELRTLEGEPFQLPQRQLLLIVNVASKCGLTPQYSGLERLQEAYAYRGFSVIGVPCNQFGGQEPGMPRRSGCFVPQPTASASPSWRRWRLTALTGIRCTPS